jgi:hypothetical protein
MFPAAAEIDKDTPPHVGREYSSTGPIPLIYSRNKYAIHQLIKINRDYARFVAACEAGNINEVRTMLDDPDLEQRLKKTWRAVDNLYLPLEAGWRIRSSSSSS